MGQAAPAQLILTLLLESNFLDDVQLFRCFKSPNAKYIYKYIRIFIAIISEILHGNVYLTLKQRQRRRCGRFSRNKRQSCCWLNLLPAISAGCYLSDNNNKSWFLKQNVLVFEWVMSSSPARGGHILCVHIIFCKSSKAQQRARMWFVSFSNSHLQAISFS